MNNIKQHTVEQELTFISRNEEANELLNQRATIFCFALAFACLVILFVTAAVLA